MFKLESIAQILQENGFGKMGKTIFINNMPESEEGILILEQTYGNRVNPQLPKYYNDSGFQVIVRNKKFEKARQIAYNIMEILTIEKSKQVDNIWVNQCYARRLPQIYARMDGNMLEASINFLLNYVDNESFARGKK